MQELIQQAWGNRELLKDNTYADAVRVVIEELDKGRLRVASPSTEGWVVNEWVKQAILMYFGIQQMKTWNIEPFEFYDKMLLKKNYKDWVFGRFRMPLQGMELTWQKMWC